jgi:hypothetical protein
MTGGMAMGSMMNRPQQNPYASAPPPGYGSYAPTSYGGGYAPPSYGYGAYPQQGQGYGENRPPQYGYQQAPPQGYQPYYNGSQVEYAPPSGQ